ncbi:hypothetical protein CN679_23970 [Bacillus pseudomycoides]|uniref:helix-turn-helix domain-containing protein n=1 Tax=Bacillus pseudomycoides TaxID=64104 RepID=UPI000BF14B77|nr:helix-turn-helix domain-containing protein [Bacillus pseudomycoides]PEI85895.1 hypothetical protein CN679_23970 [Bacillus pseudomycoides]
MGVFFTARMKYFKAEKLAILALYKDGHHSITDITAKFFVDLGTIRDWKRRYEVNGEDGLEEAFFRKRLLLKLMSMCCARTNWKWQAGTFRLPIFHSFVRI